MNRFEEKQDARRDRYEEKARRYRRIANHLSESSREQVAGIPMGQPILVGHHSERRHRRDLERSRNAMFRALEAQRKAEHYESKAKSVGRGGISSDDPEAIQKLKEKLERLEAKRSELKAGNAKVRKMRKKHPDLSPRELVDKVIAEDPPAESAQSALRSEVFAFPRCEPKINLQLIGAEVRRVKKRIEELQAEAARTPVDDIEGEGYTVSEDPEDNRIRIYFDGKPPQETRQVLKRAGFRWARSVGAWQRHLNDSGRFATKRVIKELFGDEISFDSGAQAEADSSTPVELSRAPDNVLELLSAIVENGTANRIQGVLVDMCSANAILKVHKELSPKNQARLLELSIVAMANLAWDFVKFDSGPRGRGDPVDSVREQRRSE